MYSFSIQIKLSIPEKIENKYLNMKAKQKIKITSAYLKGIEKILFISVTKVLGIY